MNIEITKKGAARLAAVAILLASTGAAGVMISGQAVSQDNNASRLQRTEDWQAISQLYFGDYPRALDGANWKAYAGLFTEDGELGSGAAARTKGRAAIEAQFSRPRAPAAAPAAPAPGAAPAAPAVRGKNMHVVSNMSVTFTSATTATGEAYWQTISSRQPGSTLIAGAGHYEDVLKKVGGKWYFERRDIINDLPVRDPNAPARAARGAAVPAAAPAPGR